MRALVSPDDDQLRRINAAIAAFRHRPVAERSRMGALLAALETEKNELLRARTAHRKHSFRTASDEYVI